MGISTTLKNFDKKKKKINKYFKFGFVRNPYSRFYSCWQEFVLNHKIHPVWTDEISIPKYINSFEKFCLDFPNLKIKNDIHFKPLTDQIIHNGKISLDYIGQLNTFNKDIKYILKKLNINIKKKYIHKRKSLDNNYLNKYTEKTKKIIGEFYKKDIELFRYSFEDNEKNNFVINIHNNHLDKVIKIQKYYKKRIENK